MNEIIRHDLADNKEREDEVSRKATTIIREMRSIYGEKANWRKIQDYIDNGQLTVDPEGVMRFRGDRFSRIRFHLAQ